MNKATFLFLVRYALVGLLGGALQSLSLYLWVDVLGWRELYLVGATLGFCVALAATFLLQKYWTFRDRAGTETRRQFFAYTTIALVNLGLTLLLLHVCKQGLESLGLDFFRAWYLVAQVVIIGVLAGASFIANYFLTFRSRSAEIVPEQSA